MKTVVEVCSRTFLYPEECPCCGEAPDDELMIPFTSGSRATADDTAREVLFPYCKRCIEHVGVMDTASMVSTLTTLSGIVMALVTWSLWNGWYAAFVIGGSIAVAVLLASVIRSRGRTMCRPSCADATRAVIYYGWSGATSTFAFASVTYTGRFAERNATCLVSVDAALQSLIEAHKHVRSRAQTSAVPARRSVDDWVTYLDKQPTRVARRMRLMCVLSTTYDEDERARLVRAVSCAELAPLFEEIEGLPLSSKKRRLDRAVRDIKADNVHEALRQAELHELAERVSRLG